MYLNGSPGRERVNSERRVYIRNGLDVPKDLAVCRTVDSLKGLHLKPRPNRQSLCECKHMKMMDDGNGPL